MTTDPHTYAASSTAVSFPSVSAAKESQALLDLKVLLLQRLAEAKRGELDARDFLEVPAMEMRRRGRK